MAKLINILLRKTDPDYPWGFSLGALPPALHSVQITWVDKGSLASEHLEPGDRVLEIEGIDTTMLSNAEVESMLTSPSNKLELLIMKKSKNTEKPMQNQEGCEMKKTVKTQDRISSRTEESGETKILNEDFLEESKIITREGTLHREIMETTECSENELKTDTSFWTCPPSDLVKQEVKKKIKEPNLACRNTSGSGYISESAIFKSLNNYRDELRKVDPREEKRQFWESCRKGDSIRRFKWGDSIKPNRGPSPAYKSDGSMESLYSKGESQAYPIPKMERSKSCEPMESLPSSNPFSESFPGEFHRHGVNSTNPFYKEFKSSKSHCDSSSDVKTFNSAESESKMFMDHANNAACNEGFKHKFTNEMTSSDYSKVNEFVSSENNEIVSSTVNEKFIKEEGVSQSDSCQESFFDRNDSSKCDYTYGATNFHSRSDECKEVSNQQELVSSTSAPEKQSNIQKTVRFEDNELDGFEIKSDSQKNQPLRLTKAIGQEDFETKCKFFEKATSAPVLCANKNAKDLVEERLKEGASPSASPSVTRKTLNSSLGTNSFPEVPEDESHLHLLKKPSDFINQQFKCTPDRSITSQNPGVIPTIKVSEYSDMEKCFDERRYENVVNISSAHHQGTLEDQGAAFCSQPIYVNMSDYIANCNTSGMERNTAGSTQNSSEHSNFTYNGCENMNNTEARKSTGGEKKVIDNFSTRDYVSTNQSVSQKSSEASNNNTVSYGTSRVSANITNQPMGGGFQWYGGISPQQELNEQARSHRGGSLDRDFYEKRTFKESSFQKVTCSSDSPYQNVESASSREYQEETGPSKNVMNRSGTPAGFYDNSNIDDLAKEIRAKSPLDISSRTFDDIRNRLGSLLGATPLNISCERSKLLISQGGVDKVEEAFQKLALQAGIVENKAAEHGAHL
ncbi:hypothetical protein GE061_016452 [Apolygus lucorum]|uniref:Uncharacterized protein n=1 Tax=Apolygus lucorum TaxID=248454 RepID=A0A6A4JY53_APOLU|nr:hypothetical protein GE061_016452 [Apolygus lucorum]